MAESRQGAGLSPTRLAWQRLRRKPAAMIGAGAVAVMVLLTIGAPWFAGDDPSLLREWVGAREPGYSHPDCAWRNHFVVGEAARSSAAVTASDLVILHERRRDNEEYRLVLRRGALQIRGKDARLVEELIVGPEDSVFAVQRDGSVDRTDLAPGLRDAPLRSGEAPPPALFAPGQRLRILRLGRVSLHEHQIALRDGIVREIASDGEPVGELLVTGDAVTALIGDGDALVAWHPLGTDVSGRDVWARVLHGGRISLLVGCVATLVSLVIGVLYGAVSGFAGGRVDRGMMGAVDVLYAIPFMFLVILLLQLVGNSIVLLFVALGAVQWLTMARIVRGSMLSLREREFIDAARLAGAGPLHILARHLIPNAIGPVIVYATLTVPIVIMEESFLAYLGVQATWGGTNIESWGTLVKSGVDNLGDRGERAWLLIAPSAAMVITLLGLNVLGDGLRDALDTRHEGTAR